MPRNVRPSFVKLLVDGRKSTIATGPKSRTGSMSAEFLVRNKGEVCPALSVEFIASEDATKVLLIVTDHTTGAVILEKEFRQ